MDSDHYIPRVLDEMSQPPAPLQSDSSKWAAVHHAFENTGLQQAQIGGTGSLFTVAWVLGIAFGLVWILRNGRAVVDQWQQNVHRRANRRRHGIPDEDNRPFNVAYAAAALARKEREKKQRRFEKARRENVPAEPDLKRHEEPGGLRQRGSHAQDPSASNQRQSTTPLWNSTNLMSHDLTGGGNRLQSRLPSSNPLPTETPKLVDPSNANRDRSLGQSDAWSQPQDASSRPYAGPPNGFGVWDSQPVHHVQPERRKHHHMDDADDGDRTSKRTRVAGEEYIDGDNDAAWMPGGSRRGSLNILKRGSKRHANLEDDDNWEMSQDKRARMSRLASQRNDPNEDDVSDVEMAPESLDADPEVTRGRKREREEADSAVGGAANDTDDSPIHPSRKRRAEQRGPAEEFSSRDPLRDQSVGSSEGDEGSDPHQSNKVVPQIEKLEPDADLVSSDASESDDVMEVVEDPACGGRSIGDIWEVNGQSFKVGLDGRRLRHALVRQQRTKFAMPKDSTHNDAKVHVDIVVEKWLNDDEYKAAKENLELAWQDTSPTVTPNKAEGPKQDSIPTPGGKRLLWAGPPSSPVKGRASITPVVSVQNPFELAPSNIGRRVTSGHLLLNKPVESPKLRSAKSFSKWEKQDLEASSLKKMRARMEKEKEKEKQQEQQEKQEKEKQEKKKKETEEKVNPAPPPPAMSTPFAPTTNIPAQAPPPTQPNLETKPAPSPFAQAPSSLAGATPGSTPGTSSVPASGFSFSKPTSMPTTQASTGSGMAPQSSTMPSFSFSTQGTTSTPAVPASSTAQPFSFVPPPTSTPSDLNKGAAPKPSFTFAPVSSTPPPAVSGPVKPLFGSDSRPPQFGKSDTPAAPSFNFAVPPTSSASSTDPQKATIPNFFAKPSSQPASAPTSSSAPMSQLPFAFAPKPQTSSSSQGTPQQPPTFQFNPPANTQKVNPFVSSQSNNPLINPQSNNPLINQASNNPFVNPQSSNTLVNTQNNNPHVNTQNANPHANTQNANPHANTQNANPLASTQNNNPPVSTQNSSAPSASVSSSNSFLNRLAPAPASTQTPQTAPTQFSGFSAFAQTTPPATNIFGQTPAQTQQGFNLSANTMKPTAFTPSTLSEPSKHIFGQPSTAFSFAKPSNMSELSKPASTPSFGKPGEQTASTTPQKLPFSFNFGPAGSSGGFTAPPSSNPFQFAQTPSTGAPTASPNIFTFGQSSSSSTPSSTTTPGSADNTAGSEKK